MTIVGCQSADQKMNAKLVEEVFQNAVKALVDGGGVVWCGGKRLRGV